MRSVFDNIMAIILKDYKGAYMYLAKDNNVEQWARCLNDVQPNVNTLLITSQKVSIIGCFR